MVPDAARQKDIALSIADKHHLAHEKVAELQAIFGVDKTVRLHFEGKIDRKAARAAVYRLGAPDWQPPSGRAHLP